MIKENINRIDNGLKELFESVHITEKSKKNNFYFEIIASALIEEQKTATVRVNILKPDLNSNIVRWSYYSDPTNESSNIIEKVSLISEISRDIKDIILKKKMDTKYFKSLKSEFTPINESVDVIPDLYTILNKYKIIEKVNEETKFNLDGSKPSKTLYFKQNLSSGERVSLDIDLKSIGIEYVSFIDNKLKVII